MKLNKKQKETVIILGALLIMSVAIIGFQSLPLGTTFHLITSESTWFCEPSEDVAQGFIERVDGLTYPSTIKYGNSVVECIGFDKYVFTCGDPTQFNPSGQTFGEDFVYIPTVLTSGSFCGDDVVSENPTQLIIALVVLIAGSIVAILILRGRK